MDVSEVISLLINFNSIKVQLKRGTLSQILAMLTHFNSIKVQLKL